MKFSLHVPHQPADIAAYRHFRWSQLRQPLGQPPDPPEAEEEARSDHLTLRDESGAILACGRLLRHPQGRGQVRSMAVAPHCRSQGLGLRMLRGLEQIAISRGMDRIDILARDSALGFYQRGGYVRTGPGPTLFGSVPHSELSRDLPAVDFTAHALQCRPATDSDGPAVARLIFAVLAEYGLAPETDGIDRDLEALEASYQGGFFDILHDGDGRLMGTVAVRRLGAERGELRRMYLRPDARGRGIGRACLGYALRRSREAGLRELELETATVLTEARALYHWAGFAPVAGTNEGRRCDLRMELANF